MDASHRDRLDLRTTQSRDDREIEFGRIVAFSDGVMAIAITLLVLNIETPDLPIGREDELPGALFAQWPDLLSYAFSFAVIGRFWIQHHRFFGALERFDPRLVLLNLVFLALTALVPFTTDLLDRYGSEPVAPMLYALILALAGLANWAMIAHALRHGLVRPDVQAATLPFAARRSLIPTGIFLASIPIALISPTAAELSWLLIFVVVVVRRARGRRR
ncbi:MAG: TMEM175 family protein [Thermoleophilaceae bacterium]